MEELVRYLPRGFYDDVQIKILEGVNRLDFRFFGCVYQIIMP